MAEDRLYTEKEVQEAKVMAVLDKRVQDVEDFVPEIGATLKKISNDQIRLSRSFDAMPGKIHDCGVTLDIDLKEYMHTTFISRRDFIIFFGTITIVATVINYLIINTNVFVGT